MKQKTDFLTLVLHPEDSDPVHLTNDGVSQTSVFALSSKHDRKQEAL